MVLTVGTGQVAGSGAVDEEVIVGTVVFAGVALGSAGPETSGAGCVAVDADVVSDLGVLVAGTDRNAAASLKVIPHSVEVQTGRTYSIAGTDSAHRIAGPATKRAIFLVLPCVTSSCAGVGGALEVVLDSSCCDFALGAGGQSGSRAELTAVCALGADASVAVGEVVVGTSGQAGVVEEVVVQGAVRRRAVGRQHRTSNAVRRASLTYVGYRSRNELACGTSSAACGAVQVLVVYISGVGAL